MLIQTQSNDYVNLSGNFRIYVEHSRHCTIYAMPLDAVHPYKDVHYPVLGIYITDDKMTANEKADWAMKDLKFVLLGDKFYKMPSDDEIIYVKAKVENRRSSSELK